MKLIASVRILKASKPREKKGATTSHSVDSGGSWCCDWHSEMSTAALISRNMKAVFPSAPADDSTHLFHQNIKRNQTRTSTDPNVSSTQQSMVSNDYQPVLWFLSAPRQLNGFVLLWPAHSHFGFISTSISSQLFLIREKLILNPRYSTWSAPGSRQTGSVSSHLFYAYL